MKCPYMLTVKTVKTKRELTDGCTTYETVSEMNDCIGKECQAYNGQECTGYECRRMR